MPNDAAGETVDAGEDQAGADESVDEQSSEGTDDTDAAESDGDDQGDSESADPGDEADSEGTDDGEGQEEALLSDEEMDALKDKPAALKKALQRAWTQKTQKLAQAKRLMDALERDPAGTMQLLAQQTGMQVLARDARQTKQEAAEARDEALEELKAKFGDELGVTLHSTLVKIADKMADAKVQPLIKSQERALAEAAAAQTADVLTQFSKDYPDWKKYEKEMRALGENLQVNPKGGMGPYEYMEMLYHNVTRRRQAAGRTREAVDRLRKGAAKTEPKPKNVPGSRVGPSRPKDNNLRDIIAASIRGEVYSDSD